MKVLLLNSVDNSGGAAKAARRLCSSLLASGVNAEMLVQSKMGTESFVTGPSHGLALRFAQLRPHLDALPVCFYPERKRYIFSPSFLPERVAEKVLAVSPDIVHLHWICEGFLRIESLSLLGKAVVWTMHDSWPFTGGCHVPFECTRYEKECGCCPWLGSGKANDLSHWVWKRKMGAFSALDLTLVAPSRWMAERAMASSLFKGKRIEIIPNGIDTDLYRPMGRDKARVALSLPRGRKLVLFNALGGYDDPNKGFHLLCNVLDTLRGQGVPVELLIVGQNLPPVNFHTANSIHLLGRVEAEEKMPLIYSAADVTVVPSVEESLCFTVMESMACGTPCVAFHVGGIPDLVEHDVNGLLAHPGDARDFGNCLRGMLQSGRYREMSALGREKMELSFSLPVITGRHQLLYEEVIRKTKGLSQQPAFIRDPGADMIRK